jgi:hypothetical protein
MYIVSEMYTSMYIASEMYMKDYSSLGFDDVNLGQ